MTNIRDITVKYIFTMKNNFFSIDETTDYFQ